MRTLAHLRDAAARVRETFPSRLAATVDAVWRDLALLGRLRAAAEPPSLEVPPSFAEVLAYTVALDEAEGGIAPERTALRLQHYLEFMPRLRIEQLASSERVTALLFHAPLAWDELPRLSSVVARYLALASAVGADPARAIGAATLADYRAARPTLATLYERTYYGRFMPLLDSYPANLAALGALVDGGASPATVIDRHLAAPLAHELAHGAPAREALFPPYLDECVAGWLGVKVLPDFAFPSPGGSNAVLAAPWLAQVGQAIERAFGPGVIAAQLGATSWREVLPRPLLDACERLGWDDYRRHRDPHFLSSTTRPAPWLKLLALGTDPDRALDGVGFAALEALAWRDLPPSGIAPLDRTAVADGLRAMCVEGFREGQAFRVRRRLPPSITVDAEACRVSAPATSEGVDPAPPSYHLPPSVAARLRRNGRARIAIALEHHDAIEPLADALVDGDPAVGHGWRLLAEPPDP